MVKAAIPARLFARIEPYGHLAEAVLAQAWNGFPARDLKVIGVTGTDGKTSTCSLITQMLRQAGCKVAMLTTVAVDYGDGAGERPNQTRLTTTGAMSIAKTLRRIRSSGAEWLVLETTSHALAQYRTWGVPYSVAVLTNISHEHLDYHGTFERYLAAKRRLFELTDNHKTGLRAGVINADDPQADNFVSAVSNPLTYGIKKGELRAHSIKLTAAGSRYTAKIGRQQYRIQCHLPGSFNVSNSLAAVGVGHVLGLTKEQIEQGIAALESVKGRMTRIDEGQEFEVIVDYAHTPDSFKKIFSELKPVTRGRLICVFGSAGRRDELKRTKQGFIAGQYCDVVIITEEDDRDCDGWEIMREIAEGAKTAGMVEDQDLLLIHQREAAVQRAVTIAKKGDLVLLLGKGHESNILTNGPGGPGSMVKRPYNEITVARQAVNKRLGR